jgi:hypothetical protein
MSNLPAANGARTESTRHASDSSTTGIKSPGWGEIAAKKCADAANLVIGQIQFLDELHWSRRVVKNGLERTGIAGCGIVGQFWTDRSTNAVNNMALHATIFDKESRAQAHVSWSASHRLLRAARA